MLKNIYHSPVRHNKCRHISYKISTLNVKRFHLWGCTKLLLKWTYITYTLQLI